MTKIQWTQQTWNPIVGCSIATPGCTNCYAMKAAWRMGHNPKTPQYHGLTEKVNGNAVWTGKMNLVESVLMQPLNRRKPTMYFVNSMGDLFHESVPDELIDRVFAVMALCPQHTFQVLTKRAKRMREYFNSNNRQYCVVSSIHWDHQRDDIRHGGELAWPLLNVWLGISVEDQKRWNERWYNLARTPAAIRFISGEPLLGPIDMVGSGKLDWVIVGGESGPNARPMHPDWARSLRDQCVDAGVPFFFKQHGEWIGLGVTCGSGPSGKAWPTDTHSMIRLSPNGNRTDDGWPMQRVGTKAAGNLLDGEEWQQMPEVE